MSHIIRYGSPYPDGIDDFEARQFGAHAEGPELHLKRPQFPGGPLDEGQGAGAVQKDRSLR